MNEHPRKPDEPSVQIDPEYLKEAGEAQKKKFDAAEYASPASWKEVHSQASGKIVEAWKMADELFSDMELATSVIDPSDDQFAVADAKSDAASQIKGVFARAAQLKNPMQQYEQVTKELGALKMRFATGEEDPEIAAAKIEVLGDFKQRFDELFK